MNPTWEEEKQDGRNKIRRMLGADGVLHGEVLLTRNKVMLFDLEDISIVRENCWCASEPRSGTFYGYNTKLGRFHNVVSGFSFVDHINRNTLDNRKANLRPTNHELNMRNHKRFANNTSGATGVFRKIMKKRNGEPRPNWVAYWYEGKVERRQAFSIAKWGEEQAKQMAIVKRQEMDRRLNATNE